ncbi:MAG: anaerobic sulfatase maturase, partial [Chloroflexi bacterium]
TFVQFIPIVERIDPGGDPIAGAGDGVSDRSVDAAQYGRFLIEVFEEWVRRDVGRVYVQMFDVALGSWVGEQSLCLFAPTCGNALAIEHNGDLYSCDHFVSPDHLLGNIRDSHLIELVASDKQRQFGQDKLGTLPRYCRQCDLRFACNGGCPKDRFIEATDGEPGLNYLCAGYKSFFGHTDGPMRMMGDLLRRKRAPAEIMAHYASKDRTREERFARAARNEPCPCGSPRKFKKCHGTPGSAGGENPEADAGRTA